MDVFSSSNTNSNTSSVLMLVVSTEYCVHTVLDQNVLPLTAKQQDHAVLVGRL